MKRAEHRWIISLLSQGGTELKRMSSNRPLEICIQEIKKLIGTDISGMRCERGRIFGNPGDAPESYRALFEKNWKGWQPGYNLHITTEFQLG